MNVLTLVGWKARLVRTALASLLWVLSLSGCGDKEDSAADTGESAETADTV